MSEIREVILEQVYPNPHRNITAYPISENKVEALVRSIKTDGIGLWPSIVARPRAEGRDQFEMAFGHHRWVAARKAGLKQIDLIVMDLDDKQMLQYMGRENGEDYRTDFMILLNTWEAGVRFVEEQRPHGHEGNKVSPIEVARILGWVSVQNRNRETRSIEERITPAAAACNTAYQLIAAKHMRRDEFQNMAVDTARQIAQRALSMLTTLDNAAKVGRLPQQTQDRRRQQAVEATRQVAAKVRAGMVAPRQVAHEMTSEMFRHIGKGEREVIKPLLDKFAYRLAADVNTVLSHDSLASRLEEIEGNLEHIRLEVDFGAVSALRGSLGQLGQRANDWHRRLGVKHTVDVSTNVTALKKES